MNEPWSLSSEPVHRRKVVDVEPAKQLHLFDAIGCEGQLDLFEEPMIDYAKFRSKSYDSRGDASGVQCCLLCGRSVNHSTAVWVTLDESLSFVVSPSTEPNGGCFPIGPDCWNRAKSLHGMEIDQ